MNIRERLKSSTCFVDAGGAPGGGTSPPPPPPPPGGGTSPPPPPPPPPPGGGAGDAWYKPLNLAPEAVKFIEDRKFTDLNTVFKSAMSSDELARSRNVIPKPDPTKLAEWSGWEELGWVSDRAKYAPKEPTRKDGQIYDPVMFKDFVDLAHEARVPVGAVEKVYQGMFDKMQARIGELDAAQKTKSDNAKAELDTKLREKWPGEKYDANAELSRRAWRALGISEGLSGKLEQIMGAPELVELGHRVGALLGEDTLAREGGKSDPLSTPAALEAEIRKLHGDTQFVAVLNDERHPQHKDFVKRRQDLIDKLAKLKPAAAA